MYFACKFMPQHIAFLAYRQITGNGPKICNITKVYYRWRRCCLTHTISLLSINLKNTFYFLVSCMYYIFAMTSIMTCLPMVGDSLQVLCHNIAEILLKVALNTKNQIKSIYDDKCLLYCFLGLMNWYKRQSEKSSSIVQC